MEFNVENIQTGRPNDLKLHIRVSRLTRIDRVASFKIGITNDPILRKSCYSSHGSRFSEMIILYKTTSLRYIRLVEKELISYHEDFCGNMKGGGGGKFGKPPYFVYLVRENIR